MAPKISLVFTGTKRFQKAMSAPQFRSAAKRHFRRATALNALAAQKAIRSGLQSGEFAKNATLTAAIKGSQKPLVDKGLLFKSITHVVQDEFTAFVGVMRSDGDYNIAKALHEGSEATVTPAMRGLFFVLWQASSGAIPSTSLEGRAAELFERYQGWLPLKASTTTIVTPSRPFVDAAFSSLELRNNVEKNWNMAMAEVFKSVAKK